MHIAHPSSVVFPESITINDYDDVTSISPVPNQSSDEPEDDDGGSSNSWMVPTFVTLGVVLIVAILGFILYKKWRCFGVCPRKEFKKAHPVVHRLSKFSVDTFSISSSVSSSGGTRRYKKYLTKLKELQQDKSKNISGEFQALKREDPRDVPVTVALQAENISKNRYGNVLPYDRNRFIYARKVDEDGNEDEDEVAPSVYINASYLSGHGGEKEFICTQGPKVNTVDDFWTMCWESNASSVVMLTRCYENGKEMCFPYWPSSLVSSFGSDIKVSLEKLSPFRLDSDKGNHLWIVSSLRMQKDEEIREITHFVLLSWPDFGVVDPPMALLSFVKHFRKLVPPGGKSEKPVVVHCSAGVGRTGVFIAVDSLYRELRLNQSLSQTESVNIFQLVQKMRTERMLMVQTLQQYTLIYSCLEELAKGNAIPDPVEISPDLIKLSDWGLPSEEPVQPETQSAEICD